MHATEMQKEQNTLVKDQFLYQYIVIEYTKGTQTICSSKLVT